MKYSEVRSKIKSGDILAFSHKGWRSWKDFKTQMVRVFTRSDYAHTCTAWVVGERVFVIEAVVPEVRIYPLSKRGSFYWIAMNAPWRKETEELALAHVGDEYSQIAAMEAYFKDLGKGNTQECAALTIMLAASDGIDLGHKQTPDAVVLQAQLLGNPIYYIEN